ncbi:MAG: lactate utilization protein C [Phycisphaerales bacterium]|nr:lactate utilization protein C [Phycisphaerales bacterium]
MTNRSDFINTIRQALGRSAPLTSAPQPPELAPQAIRLVSPDEDLPAHFAQQVAANAMSIQTLPADQVATKIIDLLRQRNCKSAALPVSPLLDSLGLIERLKTAGIDARRWDELSADAVYDLDAGITDVHAAVAETGSLVIQAHRDHGRVLSLVPMIHIAVVQTSDIVPDLFDLMEKIQRDKSASGTVIITGPSKTSDIEGNLVIGVHGPGEVHVFLLAAPTKI